MSADYSRIHRLLKILTLIQSDSTWTAGRLATECEVSERTIYRDMKMLEGAGIPYFYDPQTRSYHIRRDFFMPPVEMTLDESLALIALGEHIGAKEQIPLTKAAGRAIAKVRSQLPDKVQHELASLDRHIAIELARAGPYEGIEDVYELVRTAITKRRVLSCKYESIEQTVKGKKDDQGFKFRPYSLFFNQRAWYAVGHHGGRGEVRNLKLNRFTQIEMTSQGYKIPKDFSLDDHLGNAWRMIRGGKTYKVEIRFDPTFAETIADTHWHPTQEVQWNEDGSILFRCTVDGLDEIVWWVLSMGPHCVVKKPKALVDRVRKHGTELLASYGGS